MRWASVLFSCCRLVCVLYTVNLWRPTTTAPHVHAVYQPPFPSRRLSAALLPVRASAAQAVALPMRTCLPAALVRVASLPPHPPPASRPPLCSAPEVILGLGWSFPCDIWSVGCILVELLTGEQHPPVWSCLPCLQPLQRQRAPGYLLASLSPTPPQPPTRPNPPLNPPPPCARRTRPWTTLGSPQPPPPGQRPTALIPGITTLFVFIVSPLQAKRCSRRTRTWSTWR